MGAFEYAGNYNFIYFEHCEPEVSTSWLFLIVDLFKNVALIKINVHTIKPPAIFVDVSTT